ncbi:SDR family oxidoreductase [Bernardetia sp.]|uniref:SDR family oxidoreductase n=1 Tax=Bernardetia sp. TaxID=1937974 RepID=UPI0025C4A7C2|nr:SDR family oxidoreductase [Bernardetia sp.]
MNIKDAKVLLTGGSTGIGYQTAKLLKQQGAEVFICARTEKDVEKAISELGIRGTTADVSNEEDVAKMFEKAISEMGGLNVVINNAGIGSFGALVDTSVEDFTKVWEVNVKGAFMVGKEAAKHFQKENTGNIINIASTASQKGFAGGTAYCSSKFALAAMTECWRAELRKHNVRVMQVNPSEVVTQFFDKVGMEQDKENESKLQGTEIAHTISSLLSMNDVGFITDATVWATNPK